MLLPLGLSGDRVAIACTIAPRWGPRETSPRRALASPSQHSRRPYVRCAPSLLHSALPSTWWLRSRLRTRAVVARPGLLERLIAPATGGAAAAFSSSNLDGSSEGEAADYTGRCGCCARRASILDARPCAWEWASEEIASFARSSSARLRATSRYSPSRLRRTTADSDARIQRAGSATRLLELRAAPPIKSAPSRTLLASAARFVMRAELGARGPMTSMFVFCGRRLSRARLRHRADPSGQRAQWTASRSAAASRRRRAAARGRRPFITFATAHPYEPTLAHARPRTDSAGAAPRRSSLSASAARIRATSVRSNEARDRLRLAIATERGGSRSRAPRPRESTTRAMA